jgi:hypothetical protein
MVVQYSCKDIDAAFVDMVDVEAVWCVFLIAVYKPKESFVVVLEFVPYRFWCRCHKRCRVVNKAQTETFVGVSELFGFES